MDTDYAYAVGVIRSRENNLLTKSDYANLIRLSGYKEVAGFLESKGYKVKYEDLNSTLNAKAMEVWSFLEETVPDISVFNFLIIKNDFHNLKTVLKSKVMGLGTVNDILRPCIISPDVLTETVYNKDFNLLPSYINECAEKAYDILVRTEDSLLADSYIDRCCLDSIYDMAVKTSSDFIKQFALLNITHANLKTAYRMARSNRDKDVIDLALCKVSLVDRSLLLENSLHGVDELIRFLKTTTFAQLVNVLEGSITQFEKECDEIQLKQLSSVKNKILGPEPIIAYYIAKEMEFLNIRVIMFCKHNGVDAEVIKERIRDVYA